MKTLQDIMIEKYPTKQIIKHQEENEQNEKIVIKLDIKPDIKIDNTSKNSDKQQRNIKKIVTSILATLTILFLFYPYLNTIIKQRTNNLFFENEKPKMILFVCYIIIFTIISKFIFLIV